MKSKFITNIIIEGPDGVGKTTLYKNLLEHYNYLIPVYDRGEFSNFVYAKKYNRLFSAMQRGLPILYILLYCDKEKLAERIKNRASVENWSKDELSNELEKTDDLDVFLKYKNEFAKDYHLISINNTDLNEKETLNLASKLIDQYISKFNHDNPNTYSSWNKMYASQFERFGYNFYIIDNQPFVNNIPLMAEINLHKGIYESFTDRRMPHNLIYCQGYNQNPELKSIFERNDDFVYIINSKIFSRPEVYNYFNKIIENNLSCLTGTTEYAMTDPLIKCCDRTFGDDYIKLLAKAKATIYIARRMAYLKYTSTRLYESIIAQQIIFVDKESDLDCDILKQIHNNDSELINLLYIDENTLCDNYKKIIYDSKLIKKILNNQNKWYEKVKKEANLC